MTHKTETRQNSREKHRFKICCDNCFSQTEEVCLSFRFRIIVYSSSLSLFHLSLCLVLFFVFCFLHLPDYSRTLCLVKMDILASSYKHEDEEDQLSHSLPVPVSSSKAVSCFPSVAPLLLLGAQTVDPWSPNYVSLELCAVCCMFFTAHLLCFFLQGPAPPESRYAPKRGNTLTGLVFAVVLLIMPDFLACSFSVFAAVTLSVMMWMKHHGKNNIILSKLSGLCFFFVRACVVFPVLLCCASSQEFPVLSLFLCCCLV